MSGHGLAENDGKVPVNQGSAKAPPELRYICYGNAKESKHLPAIKQLISKDLSEPYSIYVYRYFLYQWGHLCFMVPITVIKLHEPTLTTSRLSTSTKISLA